jgi:hypothetical protein
LSGELDVLSTVLYWSNIHLAIYIYEGVFALNILRAVQNMPSLAKAQENHAVFPADQEQIPARNSGGLHTVSW